MLRSLLALKLIRRMNLSLPPPPQAVPAGTKVTAWEVQKAYMSCITLGANHLNISLTKLLLFLVT